MIRNTALSAAVLAVAVLLGGCTAAGDTGPSPAASVSVGHADLAFTVMMIPHHEQAIEMSDLVLGADGIDERVRDLAEQIKAAQQPEIDLMAGWLEEWGHPAGSGMEGMDHGGMMSDDDLDALAAADGVEAARLFLEQMIEHHEGAIDMARAELDAGTHPDVLALAQRILDAQTAEITTMREILTDL
jgi:uncharacterized protein (DUF305 family)